MKVFHDLKSLPHFKNAAVTQGTFDGVHLGHRKILDALNDSAAKAGGESVLLTFWPHPRMVLQPDSFSLSLLNTIDEKIGLLEKAGLQNLVIIPFTFQFSRTPYLQFIRDILVEKLNVHTLVIGHDHHFGKNREGSIKELKECAPLYGFDLKMVPAVNINGVPVSSSKIRTALLEGKPDLAANYLGYPYSISGTVVQGHKRGKNLGYPTANVQPLESYKLLPADGIYAVLAEIDGITYKGMASLGHNPTFGENSKSLEVNIFDFEKDIYGQKIRVHFMAFLRKETKFVKIEDLIGQISADKEETLIFFNKH